MIGFYSSKCKPKYTIQFNFQNVNKVNTNNNFKQLKKQNNAKHKNINNIDKTTLGLQGRETVM